MRDSILAFDICLSYGIRLLILIVVFRLTLFIKAIAVDAMKHPEKLRDLKEIWDSEWDELLRGVSANETEDE